MPRVSIQTPVPTTAASSLTDGKLRIEFELDLAPTIGRAVLSGQKPDLRTLVADSITQALKTLALAGSIPQGRG